MRIIPHPLHPDQWGYQHPARGIVGPYPTRAGAANAAAKSDRKRETADRKLTIRLTELELERIKTNAQTRGETVRGYLVGLSKMKTK